MEEIISLSQGLGCHILNIHKDLCLQRIFVLTYFWSHKWAQLRKSIGTCLLSCAENLILEIEGGEREENFKLYIYIYIYSNCIYTHIFQSLTYSFCGRLDFWRQVQQYHLSYMLLYNVTLPPSHGQVSSPLEFGGLIKKKKKTERKTKRQCSFLLHWNASTGDQSCCVKSLTVLKLPSCGEAQGTWRNHM